jgi:xanthine dehydrogenase accessory factor
MGSPVRAGPAFDSTSWACDPEIEMQNEVFEEIEKALETGTPLVVATVAASRGSTPRRPGAKMAVRADGSFCGTIGGGCGEAEVWQEAMTVLETGKPRLVVVDLTESPEGEDKICGGIMEVFVERVV